MSDRTRTPGAKAATLARRCARHVKRIAPDANLTRSGRIRYTPPLST
jgi:hypothetical protein